MPTQAQKGTRGHSAQMALCVSHHKALALAGVPAHLRAEALASLTMAKSRMPGVLWHKAKARWFKARKIADQLQWGDNRLLDVKPEWADLDVAPMLNITCNGDFVEWVETAEGGRPDPNCWLNPDPTSAEYKAACERNRKYFDGAHPRSHRARVMWYRRNAGEYLVYQRGEKLKTNAGFEIWRGGDAKTNVSVWRCSGAWVVNTSRKVGPLAINSRHGFEVDNVFCGKLSPQMWWPIDGYDLRAPATHSTMPGKFQEQSAPYEWERLFIKRDGNRSYTRMPGRT